MDKELQQRASESADRMTRAGMTLSAGIMQELMAEVQRLAAVHAADADYIRFLEEELAHSQAGNGTELERARALGVDSLRMREPRVNRVAPVGDWVAPVGDWVAPVEEITN